MPQKNTSKLDASYNATCSKTVPKVDPKTDQKSMKKHIWAPYGTTGPYCGLPGQALGVPLARKMCQNRPKTCFRTRKTCTKTTTSENIPWETAIRKLTIVASLHCADKTAGRKFAMVASSQQATNTGLRKFTIAASLQQLSWKPPTASKFLQRGGLGEAHLDYTPILHTILCI